MYFDIISTKLFILATTGHVFGLMKFGWSIEVDFIFSIGVSFKKYFLIMFKIFLFLGK